MLKKIPEIEQVFRPYDELFCACFINYETGHIPVIAPGVVLNGLVDCTGPITIERDVFTGHDIMLLTSSHDYYEFGQARKLSGVHGSLTIKEGVWIGSRAIILGHKPLTIGAHAVIGAGAVVTKDVGAYEMWVGNPAKCIMRYSQNVQEWMDVE